MESTTAANTPLLSKPSNKCAVKDCKDRPSLAVGTCRHCQGKFCSKHRYVEAHACPNMQSCKDEAAAKLTNRLMGEKTAPAKVN
ncbi:hypothetical protein SeMB42_g05455 [Synchytrium endobioticum]|uniref:AN1-type domain-containing protein n=1 Tax=Synchytrium endobioticum TaxID=286115 RepID=A0A507CRC8_9FUNG|nr:hypothetical protein SeMB42_g05455 [Synchytrium endobioticum]TPX45662.1 hypothetical protein SeLEV6574_g03746 [Synchytrium endobioticum]